VKASRKWKIEGLEPGESVVAVAPFVVNQVWFHLVLTDRRILAIHSPFLATSLGLARFFRSKITDSLHISDVDSVRLSTGFASCSLQLDTSDGGTRTLKATGAGSGRLRDLAYQLPSELRRGSIW
jgi:hypothetical protein